LSIPALPPFYGALFLSRLSRENLQFSRDKRQPGSKKYDFCSPERFGRDGSSKAALAKNVIPCLSVKKIRESGLRLESGLGIFIL
jgi:hypothetical protein